MSKSNNSIFIQESRTTRSNWTVSDIRRPPRVSLLLEMSLVRKL